MSIRISKDALPNSLSAGLMSGTILYRNKYSDSPISLIITEICFLEIAQIVLQESLVAGTFSALSTLTLPITDSYFNSNITWLKSSAFTTGRH